jgi:hypothetical protein
VTEPTAAQDRREAELAALESAVVAAATVGLAAHLARVTAVLRDGFRWAVTDPARWARVRRTAAQDLRRIRPAIAQPVQRLLPRAARLGAAQTGGSLPPGHDPAADPLVAGILDRVDQQVRDKLARAAAALTDGPVDTPARFDDAIARVDAARTEAETAAGDTVARAAADGTRAAAEADGLPLVVVTERDACLSCTSMAGATTGTDGLFRPVRTFAARIVPWLPDGVTAPPFHRSCRCQLQVATEGLADALRREAERSVARGESAYDSLPARLRAVDRLLAASTSRLPASVRRRAAEDRARGRFSRRDVRLATQRAS